MFSFELCITWETINVMAVNSKMILPDIINKIIHKVHSNLKTSSVRYECLQSVFKTVVVFVLVDQFWFYARPPSNLTSQLLWRKSQIRWGVLKRWVTSKCLFLLIFPVSDVILAIPWHVSLSQRRIYHYVINNLRGEVRY